MFLLFSLDISRVCFLFSLDVSQVCFLVNVQSNGEHLLTAVIVEIF